MSDAAGEHHDPPHADVSGTKNNTSGKLANCKNAGGVRGRTCYFFLSYFGETLDVTAGKKLHII
jgi:hypothetical protein